MNINNILKKQLKLQSKLSKSSKSIIKKIKASYLDKGKSFVIIRNVDKDHESLKKKSLLIASGLGSLVAQSKNGEKIKEITPSNKIKNISVKKKKEKFRYHQTNLGGSIHTDGPQLPVPPNYVLMSCSKQAKIGGDSTITDTKKIYNYMELKNKKYLDVLKQRFFFEKRGFYKKKPEVFKKPIFEKKGNKINFRYLRDYIESGYKLKKIKLNKIQIKAFNYLDTLLVNKKFQKTYKLHQGDIIIVNNNYLAHGRKKFALEGKQKRNLMRVWVK